VVGATPVSDSRCTAASRLGRAYAGAYHGDGECAGVLGVEFGALVPPAASGRAAAAAAAQTEEGGRRHGRQNGGSGLGARVGVPTRGVEVVGRGAPNAGVRPPRGRRGMGRGGRRAWEREGRGEAGRAAGWAEREAGLAQQRLSPFLFFFEILFSNSF